MRNGNLISIDIDKKIEKVNIEIIRTTLDKVLLDQYSQETQNVLDNLPGVYCFYNDKKIYVGESRHPFTRIKQHHSKNKISLRDEIIIFRSHQFHKSAIYDIETKLIDYLAADRKYELINDKTNQADYEYFLKDIYINAIDEIWDFLINEGVAKYSLKNIESMEVFKFSPYKRLNTKQEKIVVEINEKKSDGIILINGKPGTGKSIVASTLYKRLSQTEKVCLTSGTHPTVKSFQKVFKLHNKNINTGSNILKTSQLLKSNEDFKYIIVDEAHRLMKKGQGHAMKYAHIGNNKDELEMLLNKKSNLILLYDENQKVHDGDLNATIKNGTINNQEIKKSFTLSQQMRSKEGRDWINFIIEFLDGELNSYKTNYDYDVKIFDNFSKMHNELKDKSKKHNLVRLVSGYTRKRKSANFNINDEHRPYDFEIDGVNLFWNYKAENWINSKGASELKEVAYYHTIQGFDLDYAGVIIGKDIFLDDQNKIAINADYVVLKSDKPVKKDPLYNEKLKRWVLNRYKVLLTRGIKGCYIYIEDNRLRNYLKKSILSHNI